MEVQVETIRSSVPFIQVIPGVKPYRVVGPLPPEREAERTNIESVIVEDLLLHNARPNQANFSLDLHGFEFVHFLPKTQLTGNDEDTAQRFLNEIASFMERKFKTHHVFPYDLRIRSTEKTSFDKDSSGKRMTAIPPAPIIHMDLTRRGAMYRVERHLHQVEKDSLLRDGCRILVVNTWMPLENPAIDFPLLLGDRRTVRESDVVPADQILPDFLGEFAHLRHSENQQWYWLDRQVPGETTLFCSFDSERPGSTSACPHGSFQNPLASSNDPPRKSVETRSIVIIPSD